jgi:signal transduction histidine kinase/GAF domain-containing protein/DNA-binding NarL/FixJ family response regulator
MEVGRSRRSLLVGASPPDAERTKRAIASHAPGFELVTTDPDAALDALASADCLLLGADFGGAPDHEHEHAWTRAAFVEAVRDRDPTLPVVAAVDHDDATGIDAVLAAGATDVVDSDAPDAVLAARLRNVVAATGAVDDDGREDGDRRDGGEGAGATGPNDVGDPDALRRELDAVEQSIRGLYAVTTDATLSLDERVEQTLALACDRLDVRLGFLTRITDDTQRIVHAVGDHPLLQPGESCPLSKSYCRRTLDTDGLLAVVHTAEHGDWQDDPGYELFGLECYLGGKVSVDDDLYGTLCFADTDPRDEPFTDSQTVFVELLTRWVSYELERERREGELRQATRRFRALFDNPRTVVGILDPDGTLREANDTARSTLSDPDSALGRPFWETPWWASDDDAVATVREAVETAATGEAAPFECAYFGTDGAGTVSATVYPVYGPPDGDVLGDARATDERDDTAVVSLVAVGTDTTTRTEQAEQLRRQRDRLAEFASVVSHDLRSPLEVARGRLHLYETTGDEGHISEVEAAIDRTSALVDDLLELARQGETVSESTPTSVVDVARRAWNTVAAEESSLTVDLDPALTVQADPSRLRQLFENLFRNSVEHGSTNSRPAAGDSVEHGSTGSRAAPDDSVEHAPEVGRGSVSVRLTGLADRRGFAVEDDGVGIDPAARDRIFERGFTTNAEGTGFGLAIVERVVDAHGWAVDVGESASGGARFEVTVSVES